MSHVNGHDNHVTNISRNIENEYSRDQSVKLWKPQSTCMNSL